MDNSDKIEGKSIARVPERQMKMTLHPRKTTRQVMMQKIVFRLAVLAALAFSAWILHFILRPLLLWLTLIVH